MDSSQNSYLSNLLTQAAKNKASDLHLTIGCQPAVRIDGKLNILSEQPVLTEVFIDSLIDSLLNSKQKDELQINREIIFTHIIENKIRVKINIYYQEGLPAISIRLLAMQIKSLKELGLPEKMQDFLKLKKGLVIISGSFGSGRTTTATSFIEQINQMRSEHIMTIEKPIEYNLVGKKSLVDQREVGSDVNSFLQALEYVQKEDVDVLYLSEFDNAEIIEKVLETVAAGVLVVVTMTSESSVSAIEKIISSFEPHKQERIRDLLSHALIGILVQRLLSQRGGGSVVAYELLINTPAVKSILSSGKISQLHNILQFSKDEEMISLDHSLAQLVKNDVIAKEDAIAAAIDQENLKNYLKSI